MSAHILARSMTTLALLSMVAIADPADANGDRGDRGDKGCSVATLKGTYGILLQGTRPSSPGGPPETVIGVVIRRYDGNGSFSQTDTVKGFVSGAVPDRPGTGTYQVNPDCSGATQTQPGVGIELEERIVIVDRGQTVLSMTLSPPPLMVTTVQHRIAGH